MILMDLMNILINLIVETYFRDSSCIMHMYDTSMDNNTDVVHLLAPSIITANVENFQLDAQKSCRHFLLQCVDAAKGFNQVESVIRQDTLGMYNDRKYMIIINSPEAFEEFFNSSSLIFVREVLVIYPAHPENEVISLYTHKYIGTENNNDPVLLDTWYTTNASFKFANTLFPDKMTNHQGRELRAPCWPLLPYTNCATDLKDIVGNEHNIIMKYAQRFNFTLNLFLNETEDYGYIWANWSSTGALSGLISEGDDYKEAFYGGFPAPAHVDRIRSVIFTYEVSVPIPKIKYGWFMLLWVFKTYTWFMLIAVYISVRILVYLHKSIEQYKPRTHAVKSELQNITMFGFFVFQPAAFTSDVRNSIFLKSIVILILFSSVLLGTAYCSRLSSVMVAPEYEHDIHTLDEFSTSTYDLLFFDMYYRILLEDTRSVYKKILEKIYLIPNNTDFELSEELLKSRKYAVARYRRSTGGYFEFATHLKQIYGRYKPITPELFTNYYYILLRKNSMHKYELNKLVRSAEEVGLMSFWEQDALRRDGNTTFHRMMQDHKFGTENNHLNLNNLKGCFGLWMCGLTIALIAFLGEKTYTKKTIPSNVTFR